MVPSIFSATGLEPLKSIVDRSVALGEQPGNYTDVSVFAGFSYADVPNCGFSVVVVTDNDQQAATELAEQFSQEIYDLRRELNHPELLFSVESGIEEAKRIKSSAQKPVVLLEHADRMGDSTYLLRAALEKNSAVLQFLILPMPWPQNRRLHLVSEISLPSLSAAIVQTGPVVLLP